MISTFQSPVQGLSALAAALQFNYLNSGTELLNVLMAVLPLLPTIYPVRKRH